MINKKLITTVLCLCPAFVSMTHAQDKLYPELFPLSDVQLLDGPFKHAQDLNRSVLLEYDVDRLLAPFLIEAGLKPKAVKFSYISKFHILISYKLTIYIVMCFYQGTN